MDLPLVPDAVLLRRATPLPIPFVGQAKMTDDDIQKLIRLVNNTREDLRIAIFEIQALKERVRQLETENPPKPIPKTPEEKKQFSREWDQRVENANKAKAAEDKSQEVSGGSSAEG